MSLHFHSHHFHFLILKNKEIDALYFTLVFIHFADGLIAIFIPIHLWSLGYPLWQIITFYFLHSLYFLILVPILFPLLKKLSDKMMMAAGLPFLAFYFLGLGYIEQFPFLFYVLPITVALYALLFNLGYHLDFSNASDDGEIGREIGTQFALSSVARFISPFLGGLIIGFWGFNSAFLAGSVMLVIAIIPLFFFPKRTLSSRMQIKTVLNFLKDKKLRFFNLSSFGYATEKMIQLIIWPIFLFLVIGSIQKLGGVISLGLFAGVVAALFAGYLTDSGRRKKLITSASVVLSAVWIFRILASSVTALVGSQVLDDVFRNVIMVGWGSKYYNIARQLGDPGAFILSQEVIFRLSRIITLPLFALIAFFLSAPSFFAVMFAVAAVFSLSFIFANKSIKSA